MTGDENINLGQDQILKSIECHQQKEFKFINGDEEPI